MAASNMAAWRLRLLYLNYYPTWEGGVLSFRPLQIQEIEWNNHRLIIVNHSSKMAASEMAAWSLKCIISQLLLNPEI